MVLTAVRSHEFNEINLGEAHFPKWCMPPSHQFRSTVITYISSTISSSTHKKREKFVYTLFG